MTPGQKAAATRVKNCLTSQVPFSEMAMDQRWKALNAIGTANGLHTVWSVGTIEASDLSKPHPYGPVTSLTYGRVTVGITGATYLDLWKAADQAILAGGPTDHVFVEDFQPVTPVGLRVCTGS